MGARRLVSSLVLAGALTLGSLATPMSFGQERSAIRSSSTLVLVPVSALDKSGDFVPGLTAHDFQISVDGKPVESKSFDVGTGDSPSYTASQSESAALPPNTFRNISEFSSGQPNVAILFIDYLNTRLVDRMELRRAMLKYLATKLKPGQEIAVYGLTQRLVVLQSLTDDSSKLIAVARDLLKQKGQPRDPIEGKPLVKPEANVIEYTKANGIDAGVQFLEAQNARREYNLDQLYRAHRTLDAFRELAGSFAGIPGKKTIIWLTGDASPLNPSLLYRILINNADMQTEATPWWEMAKTYELLNAAAVSVFPVDIRGIANPGMVSAGNGLSHDDFEQTFRRGSQPDDLSSYANPTGLRQGEAANARLAMDAVATETGGTVLAGSNNINELLGRAGRLWSNYYVLAFTPEQGEDDSAPRYHKIKVNVARKGVHVLARRGYISRSGSVIFADSEIERDLLEAATSPVDLTSLPLQLTLEKPNDTGNVRRIPFSLLVRPALQLPALEKGAPYDLTIAVLIGNRDGMFGRPIGTRLQGVTPPSAVRQVSSKGLNYSLEFQAYVGSLYFGRVIVRDNLTGRVGTVTLPLPTLATGSN